MTKLTNKRILAALVWVATVSTKLVRCSDMISSSMIRNRRAVRYSPGLTSAEHSPNVLETTLTVSGGGQRTTPEKNPPPAITFFEKAKNALHPKIFSVHNLVKCFMRVSAPTDAERLKRPNAAARTPWHQYLIYSLLSVLLQVTLGWGYVFPDGRPACAPDSARNARMCGLEEILRKGHLHLRYLTAIVLGGYVMSTVSLWRLRRTNYCALCGATRNLLIQIATLVPDVDARVCMSRWVLLGYEIAVLKARGKMDAEESERYLASRGVLAGGEWENMVEGDRHTTVWYWLQRKAVLLAEEGVIGSEQRLQTLCGAVTLIRAKANDLMSCIDRDQPLAYSSAVGINVCFSNITMLLWKGIQWAIWFYDTEGMIWTQPKMFFDLAILVSYTTILAILFDIDRVLYNPFGFRELDIPHGLVVEGMQNLATRLGSGASCFPLGAEVLSEKDTEMEADENIAEHNEYDRNKVFGAQKRRSVRLPFQKKDRC